MILEYSFTFYLLMCGKVLYPSYKIAKTNTKNQKYKYSSSNLPKEVYYCNEC